MSLAIFKRKANIKPASAGIILAGIFLVLTVAVAMISEPGMRGAYFAVVLVFALALVPGGFLHGILVATAPPGRALAATVAGWWGGPQ